MSNLSAQYEKKRLKEYTDRLRGTLRELFQIGDISEDLDFGMYRIMHQKRNDVEEFIGTTLGRTVDEAFGTYTDDAQGAIVTEREALERTIREEIDESALGTSGILPQFLNTKRARDLNERWKQLRIDESQATMLDQHKAEIFAHIAEFFSRYYKDADFLSLPRYSKREKYAIPYNGEEIMLHWANKDQYYIKTDFWLNNYVFDVGAFKVIFEVCRADNSVNTANEKDLVFVLSRDDDAIAFDQGTNVLTLRFIRTKWNADVMGEFLPEDTKNHEKPSKENLREAIVNEILSKITDDGIKAALNSRAYRNREDNTTTVIQKHVNQFTTENTSDFFIHKNLQNFLSHELDFYLKNEVINLDDLGTDRELSSDILKQYMTRARIIKQISTRIIAFLAQLEEFQKMLFEKKKFVLATDYCMTLDYVPVDYYNEILRNIKQLTEWQTLYRAGEEEQIGLGTTTQTRGITHEYLVNHPHLVLDTKFFDISFKEKLLANLKRPDGKPVLDLDAEMGGLMIHSENWQALSLLMRKYQEQVNCIYIDPPYNTDNKEFLFRDSYQHSSWLSMMSDRFILGQNLLEDFGGIFVSIGDDENSKLKDLMDGIFSKDEINFRGNLIWRKRRGGGNDSFFVATDHEYILFYTKKNSVHKKKWRIPYVEEYLSRYSEEDETSRFYWDTLSRPGLNNPIIFDVTCPDGSIIKNGEWQISVNEFHNQLETGDVRIIKKRDGTWSVQHKVRQPEGKVLRSILEDESNTDAANQMLALFGDKKAFSRPKPVGLIHPLVRLNDKKTNIILDYFAGSGTTAHVVLNLNKSDEGSRKYILIEMGDYFHSVMKPRIEKVVYTAQWEEGKPIAGSLGQSHIFKYQTLEQYEDALDNIIFRERDGTFTRTVTGFSDYILQYMLGFETQGSPCRLNIDALKKPFNYILRIRRRRLDTDHLKCSAHDDGSKTWWNVKVDLVETFNYLLGLHVQRVAVYDVNNLHYCVNYGKTRDNETVTVVWRNSPEGEDALKVDERFIIDTINHEFPSSTLYINGQFFVKGAEHIEPKFRELMGA